MKKTTVLFSAAIALILAAVSIGLATQHGGRRGPGPGGGPPPLGMMVEHLSHDLTLTDEQKSALQKIVDEESQSAGASFENDHAIMEQIHQLGTDGTFDEAKVRELATQQAQIMVERIVAAERTKAKIFAVLTPEQRTQVAEKMKHGGPREGRPFSK